MSTASISRLPGVSHGGVVGVATHGLPHTTVVHPGSVGAFIPQADRSRGVSSDRKSDASPYRTGIDRVRSGPDPPLLGSNSQVFISGTPVPTISYVNLDLQGVSNGGPLVV